jgi:two-component system sensor histidine kinase YesM
MIKNAFKKLLQIYRNISLKDKLLILFYVQIILPIVFIGYTSYTKSSEVIKNKSFNYSQDILKMIELRIENLSKDIDSLSLQLLYDNRIYEFLESGRMGVPLADYSASSYAKNILRDAVLSREGIESICLVTTRNEYIFFDGDRSKRSISQKLPFNYIKTEAQAANGNTRWVLYKSQDKVEDIYAARVIYHRDSFEPIGLIVILIKKDFIESLYNDLSIESNNNISILSYDNEEIIYKLEDKKYLSLLKENEEKAKRGYYVDKENKMLISYVTLEKLEWKIVYHRPLKEIYSEIDELKIKIFLFVLWAIVFLTIATRLIAYDIINPINKLVSAMKVIEKEGSHNPVELNRNDELGYLGKSFNRMSEKIDYLVNIIYKEKLTRKEAELKALQAQINPHFLFNTLENINWMAQLNGVNEISDTVTALAKLMEASIGKGDKLIPLSEELEYIDNYIAILKYRFADRFVLEKNIEEETLHIQIPKLLIQPIVENSIRHGLEEVMRQGKITINSHLEDNEVIIEVIDNGVGMSELELKALFDSIEESDESNSSNSSIGLNNVNKRIRLFYGEKYGIKVESSINEYTKVTFKIPDKALIVEGEYYV